MAAQTTLISSIPFHTLLEGPPSGPLILLSHALMANHHMWDSTVRHLHSLGYATLRYDHIGHNLTPIPTSGQKPFHFDDFTHHMHSLVRTVCPGRTLHAIIGCSMGGVLAIRYAMLYPGEVAKVISCDAPGMTSLEASKPKWRERIAKFKAEGVEDLARVTVERWFPDPCTESVRAEGLGMTRTCTLEGYEVCAKGIMDYDYTGELAGIDPDLTKVMVLVGENDEAVGPREVLEDVARRIRGSVYVRMRGVGHLPPVHGKMEFERIVEEFLGRAVEGA
jgi:3-oxoadipate enol-lactonase